MSWHVGATRTDFYVIKTTQDKQNHTRVEQAKNEQQTLKYALVDSGSGGGKAAALLKGDIRQLASIFCLPIGDKLEAQATAFTAAMVLWPLIAPLKNREGGYDALQVAEHVIIACNSASVRVEGALQLIKTLCDEVRENPKNYALNDKIVDNIMILADKVAVDPQYLKAHIHEIVTPTAHEAAARAIRAFGSQNEFFIRVDSTSGTCGSKAYPDRIEKEVERILAPDGFKLTEHLSPGQKLIEHSGSKYRVDQHIYVFKNDKGAEKILYVEGRGNPPWVREIEAGTHLENGPTLVDQAKSASAEALQENCKDEKFANHSGAFQKSPNLELLSCTHYPAIQPFLETQYKSDKRDGKSTEFLNQAMIIKEIAKDLDGKVVSDDELEPLDLVITVGSEKENTVDPYLTMMSRHSREQITIPTSVKPGVPDPESTKRTISNVIDATMKQAGVNNREFKITLHKQNGVGQHQGDYELLHRFLGLLNGDAIMREQFYECDIGDWSKDGTPAFTNFRRFGDQPLITPAKGAEAATINKAIPDGRARTAIGKVARLITTGENRGVDRLAARVDVESQLLASTAAVLSLIQDNKEKPRAERRPAAILTGFTVIHNEDGERVGGENDGPPGAAILAKTFVENETPVTLITDHSAEASLLAALKYAGLATLKYSAMTVAPALWTLEDFQLGDLVKVEIAVADDIKGDGLVSRKKKHPSEIRNGLDAADVGLFITGERLSPPFRSMTAIDVSQYNMDMNDLFVDWPDGRRPFMIGIGDGGNEYGTGLVSDLTQHMRLPSLQNVVNRGPAVAATPDIKTDTVVLASVSNLGFIALAKCSAFSLNPGASLSWAWQSYDGIIKGMYDDGLSFDGVDKVNAETVDGRRMGTRREALPANDWTPPKTLGAPDATHHDMLYQVEQTFALAMH